MVSDLVPPDHSVRSDLADLARLSARAGSPLSGMGQSLGGFVRYWRTSRRLPLTRMAPETLARLAAEAHLATEVLPRNLTHFRRRWSVLLTRT